MLWVRIWKRQVVKESVQSNWQESVLACWSFWIPVQFIIFSAVPAAYRVRAVASGDFVWNVALSYLAHRPQAPAADAAR